MKQLNLGNIDSFILFGGGRTLRIFAKNIQKRGFNLLVITSSRLAREEVDDIPFTDYLKQESIDYRVIDKINCSAVTEQINNKTIGISFGAPWMFKRDFIALFDNKLLNVHSRDLPRNKGAGGSSWLIMNEEKKSANTLHLVDPGVDTGPIIQSKPFTFPDRCLLPVDFDIYTSERDVAFLDSFLDDITKGTTFDLTEQDNSVSTYYPRLHSLTQGFINWEWSADEIVRFIRAFDDPYCGASTYWKEQRIFIKKVEPANDNEAFHPFMSGLIYRIYNGKVFVATRTSGIIFRDISDPDGVSAIENIKLGDRLFTPAPDLEKAKQFHPVYTPQGLKE